MPFRPEEFSKALGRRTPADRVQGTITLTVIVIEPNRRPTGKHYVISQLSRLKQRILQLSGGVVLPGTSM